MHFVFVFYIKRKYCFIKCRLNGIQNIRFVPPFTCSSFIFFGCDFKCWSTRLLDQIVFHYFHHHNTIIVTSRRIFLCSLLWLFCNLFLGPLFCEHYFGVRSTLRFLSDNNDCMSSWKIKYKYCISDFGSRNSSKWW